MLLVSKFDGDRLVMCQLWPETRGQAKPSHAKPCQARPDLWPEMAFGSTWILSKLELAAWATAWKAGSKVVGDVENKNVQLIPILP